ETPNPCLRCNEKIKFAALADRAVALGFDAVVTGHYARLSEGVLRRAVDTDKDQSYVLAVLTAGQLARAMFPVGDTPKPQIRAEAAERGLAVADKPDSHDICFIPSGDTRAFLGAKIGVRPGAIVDSGGNELGKHEGVHGYTIGQRKGLGLPGPAADGKPRYVTGIDPETGTVRVGSAAELDVWTIRADRPVWTSGEVPIGSIECVVQVRAHGGIAPARVEPVADGLLVRLIEPLRGVARGQAVVLYQPDPEGDRVIGSGRIADTSDVRPSDPGPSNAVSPEGAPETRSTALSESRESECLVPGGARHVPGGAEDGVPGGAGNSVPSGAA
ncbi:MAG: hypothetical protein J2P17_28380, partial [Mycobacterium sp.]|nr:hypothetical protein [Mycobacterium sp.]